MRECGLPGCRHPCYVASDGTSHTFCGRTYATEALKSGSISSLAPARQDKIFLLQGCERAVHLDETSGRVHDFCCRNHAMLNIGAGKSSPTNSRGKRGCAMRGCSNSFFYDKHRGMDMDYCGRTHARQAVHNSGLSNAVGKCGWHQCHEAAWVDQESGEALFVLLH
ncbi:unnamed protein product [Discosporangium mesarthrocarpum]